MVKLSVSTILSHLQHFMVERVCLALLVMVCSVTVAQAAMSESAFKPCRIDGYAHALACTTLPHDQTDAGQAGFDITVYKAQARVRYPHPAPVVWLPDGISVPTLTRAPAMLGYLSRLRHRHDLLWLVLTPRDSSIRLDCGFATHAASYNERLQRWSGQQLNVRCRPELAKLGGPSAMQPKALATYYAYAMQQLGITQVTVVAEGRGADIASAWHSYQPQMIRYQVLDAPYDRSATHPFLLKAMQADTRWQAVFEHCVRTHNCQHIPFTEDRLWAAVIRALPVQISVKHPASLQPETVVVDQSKLALWTLQILNQPDVAQWLPMVLWHASQGDWKPLTGMLAHHWTRLPTPYHDAWQWVETCTLTPAPPVLATGFHRPLANFLYQQQALWWQRTCVPGAATPVAIDHHVVKRPPTLALAGSHLQAAPVESLTGLGQTVLDVRGVSAGILRSGCAREVVARYFKYMDARYENQSFTPPASADLQASCLTQLPVPKNVLSDYALTSHD